MLRQRVGPEQARQLLIHASVVIKHEVYKACFWDNRFDNSGLQWGQELNQDDANRRSLNWS